MNDLKRKIFDGKKELRGWVISLCALALFGTLIEMTSVGQEWVIKMDRIFHDAVMKRMKGTPERNDLVLLGIDEASLHPNTLDPAEIAKNPALSLMTENFPWDRHVWAMAIEKLASAGAKGIILDFVFTSPTTAEADEALAAAIEKHKSKVVLVSSFSFTGPQSNVTLSEPYDLFLGENYDTRVGYADFPLDPLDGMCRVARYSTSLGKQNGTPREGEPEFRSLAAEVIDLMGGSVPKGDHILRYGTTPNEEGREVYAPLSFETIFDDAIWKANYGDGEFFKNKVVMIGPVASRFQDMKVTPVGAMTGPQLHFHAVACGMSGAFIQSCGHQSLWWWCSGGIFAAWMTAKIRKVFTSISAMLLSIAGWSAVAVFVLATYNQEIGITAFCGAQIVTGGIGQACKWYSEQKEKRRLVVQFRRFVSRDIADRLVADPDRWRLIAAGRKRRVVVLFSDVRGFTSRSEGGDAAVLVAQLNEYLSAMVEIVFANGGTLDKFIGDAIMAHWGALDDGEESAFAQAAVRAALTMRTELARLNTEWQLRGWEPLEIGVGIHAGEVTAGEIGCPQRTEFGVLGDAVNLASRLEGLCKTFAAHTVVSDAVARHSTDVPWYALGKVRVKGRKNAEELYALGESSAIEAALSEFATDADGARTMESK